MENPAEARQAYLEEVYGEKLIRSVRTAGLVLFVINTLTSPLDYFVGGANFGLFLIVRVALNAILVWIYYWHAKRQPLASALIGCSAAGAMLLTVIHGTGGPTSDYYAGLILMQVGVPVLLPLPSIWILAINGMLVTGYALPAGFLVEPGAWLTLAIHSFFVLGAGLTSVASAALLDRMRFGDFLRRREVEAARDQLAELDVAKSRFTANVHHELRTPLTLMMAPLEALLGGDFGAVSEFQRGYLATMHTNARRLLKLINNLLDLSRIESDQLQIRRVPTPLGPVLEELIDGAQPLAERKGVALIARGFDGLPELNVDPEALEKILVNLIGNALKFTETGGRIEVAADAEADGDVHLSVSDTGVGIPRDQLQKIFDRFAQVDASGTRRYEGTGIGLSLAHELVALHGGRIWAESAGPGQGAQLHVVLPPGEADAERPEEILETGSAPPAMRGSSFAAIEGELDLGRVDDDGRFVQLEQSVERAGFDRADAGADAAAPAHDAPEVLIVEDNADMRRLLAFLIGREFQVRTARHGREALERVAERLPELVLTDVMMPEMSGTELCRALKADAVTQNIPVVLITSKAEREMKVRGLELGADDYVTKPFHPRELMARVRSLVRLRRLQEELGERNEALERSNAELERAMAELKEANVQLVQAERLAAVGELAAGVAHEVNNPVNFASNAVKALSSYVEELRGIWARIAAIDLADASRREQQIAELEKLRETIDLDELGETLGELAGIVSEGLDRTHRLVSDLRDFAAPGGGAEADVDLARGLESTLHLVGRELRQAGVEVSLDLPNAPLPRVRGDARALNQVFLNLLKNAAEALEGRGGSVDVCMARYGTQVAVEIRDDGPGIAPELQPRLFDPFFTTKEAGRGTGLGLSISRRIVTEHGGTIEVESAPGEGSCFRVRLPVQEDDLAS